MEWLSNEEQPLNKKLDLADIAEQMMRFPEYLDDEDPNLTLLKTTRFHNLKVEKLFLKDLGFPEDANIYDTFIRGMTRPKMRKLLIQMDKLNAQERAEALQDLMLHLFILQPTQFEAYLRMTQWNRHTLLWADLEAFRIAKYLDVSEWKSTHLTTVERLKRIQQFHAENTHKLLYWDDVVNQPTIPILIEEKMLNFWKKTCEDLLAIFCEEKVDEEENSKKRDILLMIQDVLPNL